MHFNIYFNCNLNNKLPFQTNIKIMQIQYLILKIVKILNKTNFISINSKD